MLKILSLVLSEQSYYQVLDEFSFDFRNEKDRKSFYQNYIREGNVVVNKQNLTMNAAEDNSYGMIYSVKVRLDIYIIIIVFLADFNQ